MIAGLTIVIASVFLIILGNNAFASGYSKYTNNKYEIEFGYPNIIYLDWINPSIEDNNMIIPVTAKFKDSNNAKVVYCAQSYHKMIPKIYQDSESYWEGSVVACVYGLYNYNVNIGDKNLDPLLSIQIEGEAQLCMLDDHCMKKIKNILRGKIALPFTPSTPPLKDSSPSTPPALPKVTQQEEEENMIEFCAKRVYYSNHLPPFCEDKSQEKIQIEVQKLKEKDPAGGFKGDLTKKDNKDDDSKKDNDDEGDDDDKKKND